MTTKEMLEAEIQMRLGYMASMNVETDEYKTSLHTVHQLLEQLKSIDDNDVKREIASNELEIEKHKLIIDKEREKHQTRDNKVKNGIAIGSTMASIFALIWANIYNWNKEQEGIMSSTGGKSAMNALTKLFRK